MSDNGNKEPQHILVRLTPEQADAVDFAVKLIEEDGGKANKSAACRDGLAQMCSAVGVEFPETDLQKQRR